MKTVTVRQHVKLFPKTCCSCPPCVKKENTYSVYAGLTHDSENEILRIDEISDDWNRCCCTPYHPVKMEVRQFVPLPNGKNNADHDFTNLQADFVNELNHLQGQHRQKAIDDWYKSQPVLMTMLRDDGQRCCCKMPCKLLSSFVCCACCQDGMHVYAGGLEDEKEIGRPNNPDPSRLIGSVIQPQWGGCCTPTLHILDSQSSADPNAQPFAKMEGPCCFGGWSEMCCNFKFYVSKFASPKKTGDIGMIIKKKPQSFAGAFVELFSDADVYSVEFKDSAELTPSQKISMLTGQILADYM